MTSPSTILTNTTTTTTPYPSLIFCFYSCAPAHGFLRARRWTSRGQGVLAEAAAAGAPRAVCVTGYIASAESGAMTTLGRDGSDYSASIFGRLLQASEVPAHALS